MSLPAHDLFLTSYVEAEGVGVLVPAGDVDLKTMPHLRDRIVQVAETCATVVVDLEHVRFMDSPALAILIHCHRLLAERGSRLVLRSPGGDVTAMLDMVDVNADLNVEGIRP